jgi:NADPH:quinone reductase-like Zn-dependent oxidoreductase
MEEAVTVPNNLVTVWHTLTMDLDVPLPWPKPEGYVPENRDDAILIWGGASSVGQYALQVLKYYGYTNLIATASSKHHAALRNLGATKLFDYRDGNAVEQIVQGGDAIKLVLDCIGSLEGSMRPISRIAKKGAKVAVLLPVIVHHASETEAPVYSSEPSQGIDWEEGVQVMGVRTHFYAEVCILIYILSVIC